jgi:hypothetical protein
MIEKKGRKTQIMFYVQHVSSVEYVQADKRDYQCPFLSLGVTRLQKTPFGIYQIVYEGIIKNHLHSRYYISVVSFIKFYYLEKMIRPRLQVIIS